VAPQITLPWTAPFYALGGVAVGIAGALLPALDAARSPPAQALKAGDEQRMFGKVVGVWPGVAAMVVGGALLFAGPVNGIPIAGYLSIACLLVGGILLMPLFSNFVFERIKIETSIPSALALAQLRGAPGQSMVSLAAIVASLSLMDARAIMVASFRHSGDYLLSAVLPADLYFRTTLSGETAWRQPAVRHHVRALPAVEARVGGASQSVCGRSLRSGRVRLAPARSPVTVIARNAGQVFAPLLAKTYERKPGDPLPVWVSEAVADLYGFSPGMEMNIPL